MISCLIMQGRRRIFKSGPAEEIVECRRHERGRARGGDSPLSLGVRGSPPNNFRIFSASIVCF